ncbi:MAG: GAF domain-containing protein [Roseofilum sp. SBFL]|uniref:ATP-binding protein n=1 Tax=Roseofilum sp. SBFL TaxID=2821496 RepID=UPI001B2A8587|nr:ATP-binding protein [Roseofilum sp. SBFL]MBP0041317.1 GAF domain-containing protein [Roseofilum sp. SBFL]
MNTPFNISLRPSRHWTIAQEESVYFPTSIQSHGVLLVLTEPDFTLIQVSENTEHFLGYPPESLLNQPLSVLLDSSQLNLLQNHLAYLSVDANNPLQLKIKGMGETWFSGMIHHQDSCLILELEKSSDRGLNQSLSFYHLTKECAIKLNTAQTLEQVCEVAAKTIRRITNFDRVMLYKFHEDHHGSVIAESKREDLESYLGLHYPDIDIPEPVRNSFLKDRLRIIFDTRTDAVKMIPDISLLTQNKPDLNGSYLRSVSHCHLQYLKNMGVRSSMAISLIQDQKLWGLIACHHYDTPISISYEQRFTCEFLAQSLSLELGHKEYDGDYEYKLDLKDVQSCLLESMSNAKNYVDGLVENQQNLLDLVGATGAAVGLDDRLILIGETPDRTYVQKLIQNLSFYMGDTRFFHTACLADIDPKSTAYKNVASGILAIKITATKDKYLIWFRPEIVQTVNWAGNPQDSLKNSKNNVFLCPRQSFELWKETVNLQSSAWKKCEIDAALSLQNSIIKVVLKKADELAKVNEALKISEAREKERAMQLEQTLQELKQAQTHLIQNEKMSSLGQLVAGIAHEINNPVNFIYGNLSHADNYIQDLLLVLELYQKFYPAPPEELEEECEAVDLEFLVEDLPKLLKSMHIGADRIRDIVRSLRNFSRLDESEVKAVDIHEGMDSTLLILNNRLKSKSHRPEIKVLKDYSNLPLLECYPSQLNQVFMNLIANAIDALEEANLKQNWSYEALEADPNQIKISTSLSASKDTGKDWVVIEIEDNALGIPEDLHSRLFDPFFTTKPIGKGTGIGLAISYQIVVERHQGKLTCASTVGEGTTFRIEIPVEQLTINN